MKKISIHPLDKVVTANENENLLEILLKEKMNVLQACGAQGRCATCHIHVKSGEEALSPMNDQERLTLSFIATAQANSRLACQTKILDDGAVIEVPKGMYIGSIGELKTLIGTRATQNIIHPLTGEILVEENKLILRSALEKMANIDAALETNLLEAFTPSSISNIANYFD
ncbi:ferredoxin [[Leptolyngbya] sp. PCC 7376]|uniref:2Fe-2S iron-sulfur cluster-binding protein n=1 Tax=[Leptolyngbya] sp. PCC 7376 TaxID=111781 RepID=UPI00029F112B|nr:2Fe-2S iron-sulfur cluster-binding protein [[Leptolyngbya] sp. PCC 7376]AFY38748.1 ferredoxin [[Leptolyngbya] sp. PCC 7376]